MTNIMKDALTDEAKNLLASLPREVWTEGAEGQMLLSLARHGECKFTRVNATLCRFERLTENGDGNQD